MKDATINLTYNKYLKHYKAEKVVIQPEVLRGGIFRGLEDARRNYTRLTGPKTCSSKLYTEVWLDRAVSYDIASRKVSGGSLEKHSLPLRKTANFYILFPKEKLIALRSTLFKEPRDKRKELWNNFNLPLVKIDTKFKEMVRERNNFASHRGFSSRIDMALKFFNIPKKDFNNFNKNVDEVIDYCNLSLAEFKNLPGWFYNEFNIPCFMCRMSRFPLDSLDRAFNFVVGEHKILERFRNKIVIKLGDESKMAYKSREDCFEITINRGINIRHRVTDLIHELSHVIYYLECFRKKVNPLAVGAYLREKEATKLEITILKKLSERIFRALILNDTLSLIRRVLFENELYGNTNQDLAKLYASIFNKCFKDAKQETNVLYLLDENIIFSPYSTLPHAVACTNLLHDLINNELNKAG